MIRNFSLRHKWAILLAVLLALIALKSWHAKHHSEASRGGERGFAPPEAGSSDNLFREPDPAMRQRMKAALQNMPQEQRQAVEDRMKAERAFFDSLRDLPEEQRRKMMLEHFAQNPPPPGFPPGGPGGGGPGDLDNGEPMHLPPPDVRRSMDQEIANSRKAPGGS